MKIVEERLLKFHIVYEREKSLIIYLLIKGQSCHGLPEILKESVGF